MLQTFLHQPFCSFIALMSRACFQYANKNPWIGFAFSAGLTLSTFLLLCCFYRAHKVLACTCAPRVPRLTASCCWHGEFGQVGRISQQELFAASELFLASWCQWIYTFFLCMYTKSLSFLLIHRQVKDQNKKVASLKHTRSRWRSKKSAQMLEEARRRRTPSATAPSSCRWAKARAGVLAGGEPGPAGPLHRHVALCILTSALFFLLTLPATFLSVQLFEAVKGVAFNRKGQFYSTAHWRKPEQGRKSVSWRESACLVSSVSTG